MNNVFITASQVHDGKRFLPEGAIIEVAGDGTIVALHDAAEGIDATFYEGILCPGFVNVHCHLELSHAKGMIAEGTGLIPFLQGVTFHRNDFTEEQKTAARHEAFSEMLQNGIVAVGDIANTTDTLDLRAMDKMHFHSFIESIGFTETHAQARFDFTLNTYQQFAGDQTVYSQSIVPHAPYSVSAGLFGLIDGHNSDALVSIHNQETEDENRFYADKSGTVNDLLNGFGIDSSFFVPSGKTSLQTYLPYFKSTHPFVFVHNTFSTKEDVRFAKAYLVNCYWCLCPNANLYIEGRLPDVEMLVSEGADICVGTDSLASNHELSVLAELQTLKKYFPSLEWETLLQWGCYNGAKALGMDGIVGSIGVGKKPGVVQVVRLESGEAGVKRIV